MVHEQKFKDLLSSKCQVSIERRVLDLESNPNLHNIARSDRIGFKMKNPYPYTGRERLIRTRLIRSKTLLTNDFELAVPDLHSCLMVKLAWRMEEQPITKQECIPVGCIPAAHWPYPRRGVHPRRNFGPDPPEKLQTSHPKRDPPGPDTPQDQTPQTKYSPLWTEFLTHACENITLPQLRCGR